MEVKTSDKPPANCEAEASASGRFWLVLPLDGGPPSASLGEETVTEVRTPNGQGRDEGRSFPWAFDSRGKSVGKESSLRWVEATRSSSKLPLVIALDLVQDLEGEWCLSLIAWVSLKEPLGTSDAIPFLASY